MAKGWEKPPVSVPLVGADGRVDPLWQAYFEAVTNQVAELVQTLGAGQGAEQPPASPGQ